MFQSQLALWNCNVDYPESNGLDLSLREFIVCNNRVEATTALTIVLEVFVFAVISYYALKLRNSLKPFLVPRHSLIHLVTQQGVIRFLIICLWSIICLWIIIDTVDNYVITISEADYSMNIANTYSQLLIIRVIVVESGIQYAIFPILVCRFFLQLRKYNYKAHLNPSMNLPTMRIRNIPQYVSQVVIDDLGDGDLYHCTEEAV
ncbi:hypothetical protein M422DRAFT_46274 [Sphaerobolus stellatus SS14]|uniref:Uncharacterized protein n=1 Tax=Sphaerobolus stellatus (strain SS14) TaxID=990650 RepID=A0A0C9VUB2_SPHS4|nr:hypothetical protein M422DRAFT_46274 [Sphaerobolus stellatus SS14]